jgi:hypothetical protein
MIGPHHIDVVLLLLLAHLAGDFALQSDAGVEAKRTGRIGAHVRHAAMHVGLAYLCLGLWTFWLLPVVIGLSHGAIDMMKEAIARRIGRRQGEVPRERRAAIFIADQLLHLAVIVAVTIILVDPALIPAWVIWYGEFALAVAILLIGLIVTTWVGAVVVGFATEPYLEHLFAAGRRERRDESAAQANADDAIRRGFPKGGRTIGLLERSLVFLFVITGNMTGVGFLVAAKSVFRFGEIKEPTQRKEAEYILIGTLMSFTWAIFAAWLTRLAIDFV